ncbi:MAG: HD domain-containing protein, partial [Caldilineaceae bacterium]
MIEPIATLLDAANDLKRLPRTGWLLAGVRPAESVADHSYATALLALALADSINRDPQAQGLSEVLDVGRVLQIALLH